MPSSIAKAERDRLEKIHEMWENYHPDDFSQVFTHIAYNMDGELKPQNVCLDTCGRRPIDAEKTRSYAKVIQLSGYLNALLICLRLTYRKLPGCL